MKAHVSHGCKPCPFCGAPVTVRLMRKGPDFIACTNKRECGAIVSFNNTPCDCFGASPVDYFNRRASADEIALVEDAPAVVPDVQRRRDAESDPPDDNREVIVYRPGVGSTMGIFDNEIHKRWIDANTFMFLEGVTHWMEQPEPPKGDECNV